MAEENSKSSCASPLIFYKLMTPYWLRDNAKLGFDRGSATITESEFRIPTDSREHESLFQVPLLGPGVLKYDDDIVVKVNVGMQYPGEQPQPQTWNPPVRDPMIFTIYCPREDESMGIQINDYTEFQQLGPLRGAQGEASERGLSDVTFFGERPTQAWYRFPERIELTFAPNSQGNIPWSSGYSAVDTGTLGTFAPYYKSLKLDRGLTLGIYRDQRNEEYILKYVEVYIYRNSLTVEGK